MDTILKRYRWANYQWARHRWARHRWTRHRWACSRSAHHQWIMITGLSSWAIVTALMPPVQAQVVPDGSLPTVVNSLDGLNFIIGNGAQAGTNLFHSFEQFSVPTGGSASFVGVAPTLTHVFSRITGAQVSNLDGVLQVLQIDGTVSPAHVFLLNPNGIIFGPNAQLNLGGSFLATTAETFKFADGIEFSAPDPTIGPQLTVNLPVGLQLGANPGTIVNQSRATVLGQTTGLLVRPGQTLGLLGGTIDQPGGILTAPGGRIELGSVGGGESISLVSKDSGYRFDYAGVTTFEDITLSQQGVINGSELFTGLGSSAIQLRGDRIHLTEGASIVAFVDGAQPGRDVTIEARQVVIDNRGLISTLTNGTGTGPSVVINAAESLEVTGIGYDTLVDNLIDFFNVILDPSRVGAGIFSASDASGNAGGITLSTPNLLIQNGSIITSLTTQSGATGGLLIEAAEGVTAIGSALFTGTVVGSTGSGSDLRIETQNLTVRDGTQINATTFGAGPAGNVVIHASNIDLLETRPELPPIGLTGLTAIGSPTFGPSDAGNVLIHTDTLRLRDGALIVTSSIPEFGLDSGAGGNIEIIATERIEVNGILPDGRLPSAIDAATGSSSSPAGNLTITTKQLVLRDGGQVSTTAFGGGAGGQLQIQASEQVEVSGSQFASFFQRASPSRILASSEADALTLSLLTLTSRQFTPSGDAGALSLTTPRLIVRDGGRISVASADVGNAGTLSLNADSIVLENNGAITAARSEPGLAGALEITANSILLRNHSGITASAPTGDGGNITLRVDDRLDLRNGSLIAAEAGGMAGGNIVITDPGLVFLDRDSNITASAINRANGGNITLETDVLLGIDNSDIIARAEAGQGGNINITANAIFGLAFRSRLTDSNEISASSEFGLDGTVMITNPELEANAGLVEVSTGLTNVEQQINQGCSQTSNSQFTVTGRGGMVISPAERLVHDRAWDDLRDTPLSLDVVSADVVSVDWVSTNLVKTDLGNSPIGRGLTELDGIATPKITEATTWQRNDQGHLELVARAFETPASIAFQQSYFEQSHCSGDTIVTTLDRQNGIP